MVFYLLAYTLATFGAFAVVVMMAQPGKGTVMIDELAGLWRRRPWVALGMAVMMFSLLGFPFFGGIGFFAKWYVLQVALHAPVPQTMLAIFIVLTSVVSAGYYLYVVKVMFMNPAPEGVVAEPAPAGAMTRTVLVATVVLTFLIGLAPDLVVQWTGRSRIAMPAATRTGMVPR
jgi:NADH-quinone oxidoreductase subunit N